MTVKAKPVYGARSDVANHAAQNVIDSRRLFYFYHVARLGSFTTAETVLDIAQSAMSRQIQQLETELGAQLLVRKGRGVSLTEAGAIVFRRAEAILAGMEETHIEIDAALRSPRGKVSIAAPTFFVRSFMPEVIRRFSDAHPETRLKVIEASTGHVSELLAAGEIDVAVVLQEPNSPRIETELLIAEHMDLAVSSSHPLAGRRTLSRAELKGQPTCIAANRHGSRLLIERYYSEGDVKLDVRIELDSIFLMKAAIRMLPVAGFIPPHDLEPADQIVSIPLVPPLVRNMHLAKLRQQVNPMVAPLVEEIRAAIGAHKAGLKPKSPRARVQRA
jgi:LysR family nitrogen assimilation transcriptional regulator